MTTFTAAEAAETRWLAETLWTDTRVWEVVAFTPQTITVRAATPGPVVRRENWDGNPFPVVWNAAESNPAGAVRRLRRRSDGTFRVGSSPLRPAQTIDGQPVTFTDYRV